MYLSSRMDCAKLARKCLKLFLKVFPLENTLFRFHSDAEQWYFLSHVFYVLCISLLLHANKMPYYFVQKFFHMYVRTVFRMMIFNWVKWSKCKHVLAHANSCVPKESEIEDQISGM